MAKKMGTRLQPFLFLSSSLLYPMHKTNRTLQIVFLGFTCILHSQSQPLNHPLYKSFNIAKSNLCYISKRKCYKAKGYVSCEYNNETKL